MTTKVCESSRVRYRKNRDRFTPAQALVHVRDGAGFCTACEAIVVDGIDDIGTTSCPVCGAASVVTASDAQLCGALNVIEDERPTLAGMLRRDEKPRTRATTMSIERRRLAKYVPGKDA